MNGMSWDGFRYFLAVAEGGSLTTAAKNLGSNQPTVGRHIDALESALGVKLFQRSVKGLMLTEEGVSVFEQLQSIESDVLKIQRSVQGEVEEPSGTVRLALPEGLSIEVLTPLLPEFYSDYSNIRLILNVSSNSANLTRGEADIAVRLFRPKEANLVVRSLGRMSMGLFASAGFINSYGVPKTTKELKQYHVITYGDQLADLLENSWLLNHTDPSKRLLSSDNTTARLRATIAGVGISIQPHIFCSSNTDLIPVLENVSLPDHEVWLVYHKDLRDTSRIRAVVNFLVSKLTLN